MMPKFLLKKETHLIIYCFLEIEAIDNIHAYVIIFQSEFRMLRVPYESPSHLSPITCNTETQMGKLDL